MKDEGGSDCQDQRIIASRACKMRQCFAGDASYIIGKENGDVPVHRYGIVKMGLFMVGGGGGGHWAGGGGSRLFKKLEFSVDIFNSSKIKVTIGRGGLS